MNPKNIKLKDCWKKLDFEWRKQIYLNYRLSKEDIACRTSAFLDDSFGLNFIMVRKFNLESDNPNADLVNLNNYIKEISFYETPEYPTNKPSLYYSAENFKGNITILNNPFEEVQKYFSRKSNSL